jgi:hypothetical protein
MYRRDLALGLGGCARELDYTRDVFLATRLACEAGALFLEREPLVTFVTHPGQDVFRYPVSVRISEQVYGKRWLMQHLQVPEGHRPPRLDALISEISLRETLLSARAGFFRGAAAGLFRWLSAPDRLGGLRALVQGLLNCRPGGYAMYNGLRRYIPA